MCLSDGLTKKCVFSRVRTTRVRKYCADPIAMCNKVISDLLVGCSLLFSFRSLQQVVLAARFVTVCSVSTANRQLLALNSCHLRSMTSQLRLATKKVLRKLIGLIVSRLPSGGRKGGALSGPQRIGAANTE
jgi:hypothetical protein